MFDISTADTYGADYGMGKYLFAKQVTFVTDDGTEFIEHNVALPVDFDGGERYDKTAYPNRYVFDYPIEEGDSRFTHDIMGVEDMAASGGTGYWQITATVNEEIPYDTIAEIDENLKQGEIVEVTQGAIGNKIGTFNLTVGDDLGSRYLDYDADVIYNDLKDLFSTSSIQKDAFFVRDWGMATFVEGGAVDAKDRLLHVGIDYTQYVTEDGTTLKAKEYGVHEKDTFDGYEYVTTRTEANGDTVHVYKKVTAPAPAPTPTPEPEQPVTPTDPTPTQPETPTNPAEETPAVPNPTPEPEVPRDNSGNVNGGNDEDTTPANPTDGETPVSPTPTPNPTPEPEHPVEDNTPVVPTPTPEPNVPVEETPNHPVNPGNPAEETPVNPTPEPEVPNNPTEDNKPNAPAEESKPDLPVNDTKSSVVQEGGTPPTSDSILAYVATLFGSVMSGAGIYMFKKKESE